MSLPEHTNEDYGKVDYWDDRYREEETFEWCCSVENFSPLLEHNLSKDSRVLVLGCGNSEMSADLYELGYRQLTNVDYSSTVIEKMEKKYKDLQGMSWQTMDMFSLTFPEQTFDAVLEKCTFDVLFVRKEDPWNTSEETLVKLKSVMQQVDKVLRPGGKLISISFTQPHFRLPLLRTCCPDWHFEYKTFGQLFHYFFYIGTKNSSP